MVGNPKDFPNALREHCMYYVKDWKNSDVFLKQIDAFDWTKAQNPENFTPSNFTPISNLEFKRIFAPDKRTK